MCFERIARSNFSRNLIASRRGPKMCFVLLYARRKIFLTRTQLHNIADAWVGDGVVTNVN